VQLTASCAHNMTFSINIAFFVVLVRKDITFTTLAMGCYYINRNPRV
jgi:hypothetical protein